MANIHNYHKLIFLTMKTKTIILTVLITVLLTSLGTNAYIFAQSNSLPTNISLQYSDGNDLYPKVENAIEYDEICTVFAYRYIDAHNQICYSYSENLIEGIEYIPSLDVTIGLVDSSYGSKVTCVTAAGANCMPERCSGYDDLETSYGVY